MNNLSVIGIGRLGLCFGLTLEESGYNVLGCDLSQEYVDSINNKAFNSAEPGVNEKLQAARHFGATTSLIQTVNHSNIHFVTVASYSEPDGRYDVSQVDSVVDSLVELGYQPTQKHLIICTNVNPGYSDTAYDRLANLNWKVSFNPETIAQGTILQNQKNPDAVYIGVREEKDAREIEEIYLNIFKGLKKLPSFHIMSRLEAELTKVSLNCFLTCKISFANMVGDLATKMGADPSAVLRAVGSDSRINNKFFRYGFGWGGPCFPRDTRAFVRLAKNNEMSHSMCTASIHSNEAHLDFQVEQFLKSGMREYYADSVTYKPGTIILEESQQLEFAYRLAQAGVSVTIEESAEVITELQKAYGSIFFYVTRNS